MARVPADYVTDVLAGFGKLELPTWGGPDDPDPVRRAARLQEQVSRTVKARLRQEGTTQTEFAARVGVPRSKLNRLLSGQEWARLHELERLLGGVGETMVSVGWAVGDASRQPQAVQRIIATYLHEQLAQVEGGSARTAPGHPSTSTPQR